MKYNEMGNLTIKEQTIKECEAMAKYAMQNGLHIPSNTLNLLEQFYLNEYEPTESALKNLAHLHNNLTRIIDPAKPSTVLLLYLEKERNCPLLFLGGVPLVRKIMMVSLLFLIAFISFCTFPMVNEDVIKEGVFHNDFMISFVNITLIILSAGLGATFSALFTVNKFITKGTYDPKYDSSYWSRLVLGIMAGLIIATLIPINIGTTFVNNSIKIKEMEAFSTLILAMLGGFSATLLYRFLNRLVETVESLVTGNPKDKLIAVENVTKAKMAEETSYNLLQINNKLLSLQYQISRDMSVDEIKEKIGVITSEIVPYDLQENLEHKFTGKAII